MPEELTPEQREWLHAELEKIEEALRDLDAMLTLLCRSKGIDPEEARKGKLVDA